VVTSLVTQRAWCVSVSHRPSGAGEARARLSAELAPEVGSEALADAISVIAELVGNAIRHARPLAGDVIRVSWSVCRAPDDEVVRLTVTDGGGTTTPVIRTPDPDALDGRGLAIVEALSDEWGFERDGLGQSVWAEIHCPIPPLSPLPALPLPPTHPPLPPR
jgi:two-component sensor histidine kinase